MIVRLAEWLLGGGLRRVASSRPCATALRSQPIIIFQRFVVVCLLVRRMIEDDDCCCELRVSGDAAADRRAWNASARLAARSSPCKAAWA